MTYADWLACLRAFSSRLAVDCAGTVAPPGGTGVIGGGIGTTINGGTAANGTVGLMNGATTGAGAGGAGCGTAGVGRGGAGAGVGFCTTGTGAGAGAGVGAGSFTTGVAGGGLGTFTLSCSLGWTFACVTGG